MSDESVRLLLEEVRQVRKLVELLAEPAMAQRDAKLRAELRRIVGSGSQKQQAVLLMDGKHTQKQLIARTSVHGGNLSTMIGKLNAAGLLEGGDKKQPKLMISIPSNFFDARE
jgi:hypothetical protein